MGALRSRGHSRCSNERATRVPQPHRQAKPFYQFVRLLPRVFFETYAPTVDVNDPVPPKKEPTEAEGEQYLQLLKDAIKVHMYAPQANASSGLEVLRELEKRNSNTAVHA